VGPGDTRPPEAANVTHGMPNCIPEHEHESIRLRMLLNRPHRARIGVPAELLLLGSALSVQAGSAVAKSLFTVLGPPGVVFLRLVFGSLLLCVLIRPRFRAFSVSQRRMIIALGALLACLNLTFYEAIDHAPLGIAVTIEFVGPLSVAIWGSRRRLDAFWIVLAALGILLLADGGGSDLQPIGIILSLVAGVLWALFIILGGRVSRAFEGRAGLAPATLIATILLLPSGVWSGGGRLVEPNVLGAAAAIGLLSTAVPWSLELEALRRLPARVFGVLVSLSPAVAAVWGLVLLGEHLSMRAWLAIGLVIAASAGASWSFRTELARDV
jgi:inner membrane transporter RhtA